MSTPHDEPSHAVHSTEQSRGTGRKYTGDQDAPGSRLRPDAGAVSLSLTAPRETPHAFTDDDGDSDGDNSAPEATRGAPVFPPFNAPVASYREPQSRPLNDPHARPQWDLPSPQSMARRLQSPHETAHLPSVSEVIEQFSFGRGSLKREDDDTGRRDHTERSVIQAESVEDSMDVDSQHTVRSNRAMVHSHRPAETQSISNEVHDDRTVRTSPPPPAPSHRNSGAVAREVKETQLDSQRGHAAGVNADKRPSLPSIIVPAPPGASAPDPQAGGDASRRNSTGTIVQPTPFNFPPPPQPQPAQPRSAPPQRERRARSRVSRKDGYKSARAELKAVGIERVEDDPEHVYMCPNCKGQVPSRFKPTTSWDGFVQHYSRCGQVPCHFCGKSYTAKGRPHHMHRHLVGNAGMKPCTGLQNLIRDGVDTYGRLRDWMVKNDKDLDIKYIGAQIGRRVMSAYGKGYNEPINIEEFRIEEQRPKRPPRQKPGQVGTVTTKAMVPPASTTAAPPPASTSAIPPAQSGTGKPAPALSDGGRRQDGWAALVEATVAQHDAMTRGQQAPDPRRRRAVSLTPSPPPPPAHPLPLTSRRGRSYERAPPRGEQGMRRRSASPLRRSPSTQPSISAESGATTPTHSPQHYDEEGESEVDEDEGSDYVDD